MGALILAGAVMLGFALRETTAKEPPGWVAMNEQVEAVLASQAKEEEQANNQEKGTSAVEKGAAVKADNGAEAAAVKEPQADQADQVAPSEASSRGTSAEQSEGKPPIVKDEADSSGKIDINRATAEQLDELPGIGAAKAKAIIADREKNGPFQSTKDLLRVKGIGTKLLEKMNPLIVAGS